MGIEHPSLQDTKRMEENASNEKATKDGVANLGTTGSGVAKELKKGIGGEDGYQPPPPVTLPKN